MKKGVRKSSINTISIFGKKITSNNLVALILCLIIGIVMISRTLYINQKLSTNTDSVIAKVIDIYWANHGQRLWGYEMKYKFFFRGNEFVKTTGIQENEIRKIHVGDCIEVIVSLDDSDVQKWNRDKGTFKCP